MGDGYVHGRYSAWEAASVELSNRGGGVANKSYTSAAWREKETGGVWLISTPCAIANEVARG